jgi:hypothetical protein
MMHEWMKKDLERQHESALEEVEKAKKSLSEKKERLAKIEEALRCDHDIQCKGSFSREQLYCKKCGYSEWWA